MFKISALLLVGLASVAAGAPAPMSTPTGLMCELLAHPELTEITDSRPEFSWIVGATRPGEAQTAYQIQVSSAIQGQPTRLLWDSGRAHSDRSTAVEYGGKALTRGDHTWRVRTWDRDRQPSAWSVEQRFRVAAPVDTNARYTVARYPVQQSPTPPRRVIALGGGRYFLDFGRAAFAGLKLRVNSPESGRKLIVHLGETVEAPWRVHRKPGGSIRYLRAEVELRAGDHTYVVPLGAKDGRLMSPQVGPVMPFRYVEVENCPSPLTVNSATQTVAHYPFDDQAASFHCSDPKLDQVWELCRYSMKATSFGGVYVDGDRERLPYEADAYINQLGHYAVDREFTLARYSHEYLILHATWPTEWSHHSVLMAHADYMHTGDRESLDTFYSDLKAKTLQVLAREDGLISTVQPPVSKDVLASIHLDRAIKDIVDWPLAERDGYEMRPVNTVVNAFHYRSLTLMAEIADALGKADHAAGYRSSASRVSQAINQKLFDPKTGLYVDGEGSSHSSLHANMFPLAFGVVPDGRRARVVAFVKSKGMACSVYAAQYLLEALYAAGEAEHARKLITAPGDRSWAHMLDVGTTITFEAWDNKYKPNQDWNHAWGAAPANIIPRQLLGVQPLEPGFRRFRVQPQLGGLGRASGTMPTIRGPVSVDVHEAQGRFELGVSVPANTTAQVHLPRTPAAKESVRLDGREIQPRRTDRSYVIDRVGSGRHTLTVTADR